MCAAAFKVLTRTWHLMFRPIVKGRFHDIKVDISRDVDAWVPVDQSANFNAFKFHFKIIWRL